MWRRTQRVNYRWQWNQYRVRLLFHFHFLLIWLPHVSIKVHRNIRWPILAMKKSQRARIHPPIHIDTHTHTHTHSLRKAYRSFYFLSLLNGNGIHPLPMSKYSSFSFFFSNLFISFFHLYPPFPFSLFGEHLPEFTSSAKFHDSMIINIHCGDSFNL